MVGDMPTKGFHFSDTLNFRIQARTSIGRLTASEQATRPAMVSFPYRF